MEKSKKNSNAHSKVPMWLAQWQGSGQQQLSTVEITPQAPQATHESLGDKIKGLKKNECCAKFVKILFVVLAVLTILKAIGMIAVAILTAVATKVYSTGQSGRLVALILLAVTAAVTVAIIIYALVAVFTKKNRPIHVAAVVLIVLALVQAIIAGTSISPTEKDQAQLSKSLADSFRLTREHNPRHVKTWASTQHNLQCCGMYGPDDYRPVNLPPYFPPDVPVSCCPSYDADRSDLVQERERELCKARKEFYDIGCKHLVVEVYVESSSLALHVLIGLIVLEIILSITAAILSKKRLDAAKLSGDGENQEQK